MQHDVASRREICCLSTADKLRLAAERIHPSDYRKVAQAIVALDVPARQVERFALAIAAVRGKECHRHFMGEYADLVWDGLREEIAEERRNAA